MGISFSCPLADIDDLDSRIGAVLVKSISFGGSEVKTASRSVSFNGRDSESKPNKMKSFNSAKIVFKGSLSFNGREVETMISFTSSPSSDKIKDGIDAFVKQVSFKTKDVVVDKLARSGGLSEEMLTPVVPESGNHRYQAALKLQKVYKSFRTRRQLADCAVLVEQRWWKLLDFAELKRSSISFFEIEKPETAVSRWARARTRAAKVGKGLSKDEKARKLALQHWLEAIDPRHRYGHNLQFYYLTWLHCESKQPFFYWLDIGEGREVNLDRCVRSKLQQQCIKYLGPTERKAYEVTLENGRFFYRQSGELIDTRGGPPDAKWIFVLSASKTMYVGLKNKGTFQHSSFLAGGATLSAGRLVVEDGLLQAIWPHSGHYLPTEENFQEFIMFLREHNVDLTNVKKNPPEGQEEFSRKSTGIGMRREASEAYLCEDTEETNAVILAQDTNDSTKHESDASQNPKPPGMSKLSRRLRSSKLTKLEIPKICDVVLMDMFRKEEVPQVGPSCSNSNNVSPDPELPSDDGYETAEETFLTEQDFIFPKMNLFDEDQEDEKPITKEQILMRINSHRGMRSYQLAKQLSSKWTTGAGPRIGCMRDYPSELQFRVLEQANLSPRGKVHPPLPHLSPLSMSRFSPKVLTPTILCREETTTSTTNRRSSLSPELVMLSKIATPYAANTLGMMV